MDDHRPSAEDEGWEDQGGVSASAWRSQFDAKQVGDEIQPYLDRHGANFVDRWLEWDGDEATLVVAFTADVDAHQAALGPRVRVCRRPCTRKQLERIADELMEFSDEALPAVTVMGTEPDPREGLVVLQAVTTDPDALRAELTQRYGERVRLEWLGPDESVPTVVEITGWDVSADDLVLTARWYGSGGDATPLEVRETASAVELVAREMRWVGAVAAVAVPGSQRTTLASALAGREVIDATTGATVRRGPPRLDERDDERGEVEETLLDQALRHFAERDFAAAVAAFDRLAELNPSVTNDARIARKRRIAVQRAARS